MNNVRTKIAPPWITFVNEIAALFSNDPAITVIYDNSDKQIEIKVEGSKKADAISRLLPVEKTFGNVSLKIKVIPSNLGEACGSTPKEIFDAAFEGNPVYAFSRSVDYVFCNALTYVVFKNRVVQFFNDNLNDIYGNVSTLYQDIAREVFEDTGLNGVFFCTDVEERVGKPLGEWP